MYNGLAYGKNETNIKQGLYFYLWIAVALELRTCGSISFSV